MFGYMDECNRNKLVLKRIYSALEKNMDAGNVNINVHTNPPSSDYRSYGVGGSYIDVSPDYNNYLVEVIIGKDKYGLNYNHDNGAESRIFMNSLTLADCLSDVLDLMQFVIMENYDCAVCFDDKKMSHSKLSNIYDTCLSEIRCHVA